MPEPVDNSTMMGGGPSMMGGGTATEPDPEMLAQMPVDRVFTVAAQVCSACHTQFRAARN